MAFLEQLKQLDAEILRQIERSNLSRSLELVQSVPAIKKIAASATLAELDSSMVPFPTPKKVRSPVIVLADGEAYATTPSERQNGTPA
jgi:transposase